MRSSFRLLASLAVALLGTLFATPCARAQSTATLTGTLTDPSGAAVAQAEISAERLPAAPGSVLRTASGTDGGFALTLAPGEYRLRVAHPMFARIERQITLAAGERRELPLRLELERLAATVVVSAQAEPAAADSTSAPVSVGQRHLCLVICCIACSTPSPLQSPL